MFLFLLNLKIQLGVECVDDMLEVLKVDLSYGDLMF